MYKLNGQLVIALLAIIILGGVEVRAQVSIQANTTITEDFNSLGTSATAILPSGWKTDVDNSSVQKVNTYAGALTSTSFRAGNNFSASSYGIYNYGAGDEGTATDRSLGWYAENTIAKSGNLYVWLRNTGATQINGLTVSFDVEKYRKGTNSAGYRIQMYYSTNGSTWTNAGSVYRTSFSPDADNNGYSTAPGTTNSLVQMSLPVTISASSDIYIAWNYSVISTTSTSNSQGLGIDNVTIFSEPFPLNSSYSWVSGSTDFSASSSWNPARTNPKSTDILVFGTGGIQNVTLPSLAAFGRLQIQNNTTLNISSSAATTATITGNSGALNVTSGSKLNLTGSNPISINLSSNTSSTVNGEISFSGAGHRILPQDVSSSTSLNFESSSIFTANTGFTGNPFGSQYSGTVKFKSGSSYVSISGGEPFGTIGNVTTFESGSLYKHMQNTAITLSGRTYSNIEIDNASYNQLSSGTNQSIVDTLKVTNAQNVNISTSSLQIKGNINVINGNLNFLTGSYITFSGTKHQYISNNSNLFFNNGSVISINAINGDGIVLNNNMIVDGLIFISNGYIRTQNNTIEATNSIYKLGSGYIIGNLKKPVTTSTTQINYEIGTDNAYSPVSIEFNNVTASGSMTVTAYQTYHPNSGIPLECLQRYWEFDNEGISFSDASLTLNYSLNDFTFAFTEMQDESNMQVGMYGGAWSFPFISVRSPGGSNDGGSITVSGITGFSSFTSTRNESALPVELTSFTYNVFDKRNVKLLWETASELNNSGFEIERSIANKDEWTKIGFKEGRGTTNNTSNYTFEDRNLISGNYNYRLKQIDYNGNFTYLALAGEVIVSTPAKFDISQNYPNPFNPVSKVNFDLPEDAFVSIQIYDMTGRSVKTIYNQFTTAGYHTAVIDASSLTSGVYFYKFTTPKFSKVMKMVVVK